jgi:F0F1-type ATP synthase membrane subunit a
MLNLLRLTSNLFSTTTPLLRSKPFWQFVTKRTYFLGFGEFFITTVEVIGKLIRPVSLTARLGANISAGHLLWSLFFAQV